MDASNDRQVRYLGGAFLVVFATSLAAGLLGDGALGGDGSPLVGRVPDNLTALRASNLLQLLTAIGIVPLAALLYVHLEDESRTLALMGFGWWLAEAILVAVSALGTYGLMAVTGAPAAGAVSGGSEELLARLFLGIQQNAFTACMLAFTVGALAFYPLMARARLVPGWMAAWGVIGAAMLLVATLVAAWDHEIELGLFGVAAMVVYVPFEPVIGSWLLARGAGAPATDRARLRGSPA